jgi:NAD(P)-dependent dehydrogenase (short-subunit alcohol dehydrogenase family)
MGKLAGRTALITGAGSGIGRETARLFAADGATVVACDRNLEAAGATVEALEAAGGRGFAVGGDVSIAADVEAMVAAAERETGGLHILFNNAGIFPEDDGLPEDTPEAVFDQVVAVNLKGVFLGCKYGIPALLRVGGGVVINTASFVAVMGAATAQIAYTASKGGVLAMTREIAVAYARRGIRANALCPGPVNTPLLEEFLAEPVARAALFLASPDSSYVNGATFLVDGGISAAYVTPE